MKTLTWGLTASLVCLGAGSVTPEPGAVAPSPSRPNLLLITVDTTRADYLGSYGYTLPTSPNLDGLAARGVRFATALTQVPLTGPSHATMLTGLYPHEHGAVRNGVPLAEAFETLPEVLKAAGYRNAAFLAGWTLRANLSGLSQGFDVYDDRMQDRYRLVNTQRFAQQVTPIALEWLQANHDTPFFLWVHYFDPHYPYVLHDEFVDSLSEEDRAIAGGIHERQLRYASEVAHMDARIGEILAALRRLDLDRRTLVVVAGDHGENLGEHGYVGHGKFLYEEVLHVPLIFSWPGAVAEGLVVETPVGLLDLAPTILSAMNLRPLPLASGIDLSPLLTGAGPGSHAARQIRFATYPGARKPFWRIFSPKVSMLPTLVGYREGSMKVVYDLTREQTEVFDLVGDGGETRDLLARYPGLQASGNRLVSWIESTAAEVDAEPQELDPEDEKLLRSLGYNQ